MPKKVLHTGIAVPDLQKAKDLYKSLGYQVEKEFHKPDLDAEVAMMVKGESTYEIFQFNKIDHPQVQFIRNHIAFYSDNLEKDVNRFISEGYKLTIPITEGVIFRYAYLQDSLGMNYELATAK